MIYREVGESERKEYDRVVSHPLQSWEWGEFRKKTETRVIRRGLFDGKKIVGGFQLTVHPLPKVPFRIGYLPKGSMPDTQMLAELVKIGRENRCIFIKLEPNVEIQDEKPKMSLDATRDKQSDKLKFKNFDLRLSPRPLFTKYTFQLDLTKTEDELLKQMHPKTRYNTRLAEKKSVVVKEDDSKKAFDEYLRLTFETTQRQNFFAHNEQYHQQMWETLHAAGMAYLLTAIYQGKTLATWVVFLFNNILYYPYGASSSEHREVMASNLMMWEAMRWGKAHGARLFDLWGALGPDADPKDPWHGFHRFKEGYAPRHVEFIGSYDLVLHPLGYQLYTVADRLRWAWLWLARR